MGGVLGYGLVVLALAVAVGTSVAPLVRARRLGPGSPAARMARRRSVLASLGAGAAGVAALIGWLALGPHDVTRAYPVLPGLVGIAMTVAAVVAERTWPRPRGEVRTATLRSPQPARRAPSGAPGWAPHWAPDWALDWALAAAGAGVSVVLLLVGALTDDADGRMGRLAWPEGGVAHGPYPGSFYAAPILAVGLVLAALTAWGLLEVERRPALRPGLEEVDAAARAASRVRVLRGATFASLATAGGLLGTFAVAWSGLVSSARDSAPGRYTEWWWTVIQWGSGALILVALAALLLAVRTLVRPAPPMPVDAVPAPADAHATAPPSAPAP